MPFSEGVSIEYPWHKYYTYAKRIKQLCIYSLVNVQTRLEKIKKKKEEEEVI